jgi:formylglycine-generating enzyme required for sulfatase activity
MPPNIAINTFQRFVVLGAPGMGKTTMFRFIAYTVARLGLGLARPGEFLLEKKTNPVPLYLPLTELKGYSGDLLSCLKSYLLKRFPGCAAITSMLDELLKRGECLVLLDSLDEVPSADVNQVKDSVKGFLNNSDWLENIVALSCREASWIRDDVSLAFPAVLQIVDLDDAAIGEYLFHWFGADESETALQLKEKICSTPPLKALASNPFLLSLIAWLSQTDKLPERRVELYVKCTDALLREKHKLGEQDRYPTVFGSDHFDLKTDVLTDVGYEMMLQNQREIGRKALREIIRKSLGSTDITDERPGKLIDEIHLGSAILRETNAEHIYEFQHNTFREYYAARKLAGQLKHLLCEWENEGPESNFAANIEEHAPAIVLLQKIADPLWTETNRLSVGLLENPTPVLQMLFEKEPTLAARCYLDADPEKVDHAAIKKLWTERIERQERVRIIRGIKESLKDDREVIDFIAGVFLTAETDSEVLYYCDDALRRIGSDDAARTAETMFDQWPKERRFQTHKQAFAKDRFWRFAEIADGEYSMGGEEEDDEMPIHQVLISPFQLGCYVVTVEQYARFDPGHKKGLIDDEFGADKHQPVVRVSWFDAYIFSKWANCRLPSEAEWEYACRAGTSTPFNTGENLTTEQANYDGNYPYKNNPKGNYLGKTTPVGTYPSNSWGLFDMHGNVYEWCLDWYGEKYYNTCKENGVVENPLGPESGSYRVIRGGSWLPIALDCRSAGRYGFDPGGRNDDVGFRLVFVP